MRDFLFLTKCVQRHGPIFNTTIGGQIVTCIADHKRTRTLFAEHEAQLEPLGAPYAELVPGGFLRQLTGDAHRRMRRIFVHAMRPALVEPHEAEIRAIAQRPLSALAERGRDVGPDAYAPFGFDHHICPAGDLSIRIAAIVVETLARGFDLHVLADGPHHRGPFHWEPARAFAVALTARP